MENNDDDNDDNHKLITSIRNADIHTVIAIIKKQLENAKKGTEGGRESGGGGYEGGTEGEENEDESVVYKSLYKHSPLMLAAYYGNSLIIGTLLRTESVRKSINLESHKKFTALMYSAMEGHTGATKILLEHGADPHIKNIHGDTALHLAVKNNKVYVVYELMNFIKKNSIFERNIYDLNPLLLAYSMEKNFRKNGPEKDLKINKEIIKTLELKIKGKPYQKIFIEQTCPICTDNIIRLVNSDIIALNCGHMFHKNCVCTSLGLKINSCPICRNEL